MIKKRYIKHLPYYVLLNGGFFDIVIGNPPYGVSIKDEYRTNVLKALGKVPDFEIYYYFIEVAKGFLKQDGIKSYIIPNTFLFNVFASDYRKNLLIEWKVKIVDCTAFKIFEGATVYNAITIFSKTKLSKSIEYKITQNAVNFQQLSNNKNETITIDKILKNNQNWCLVFKLNKNVLDLVLKIRENSSKLSDFFPEFSQGLIAYDKYQGQTAETIKNRIFHYNKKDKDNLKKWLWGSDVTRYSVNWNGCEWIDYCDGIANPRNPKFFKNERLLIREITNPSLFCGYTDEELYHDPANIVILKSTSYDLKVLLAILNSKIATFYHFNSSPKATKGAFPKILVEDIKYFPIPTISHMSQKRLIAIVNKILDDKKSNPLDSTINLEREVDEIVFRLYNLNYEEVKIIEPKFWLSKLDYNNIQQ